MAEAVSEGMMFTVPCWDCRSVPPKGISGARSQPTLATRAQMNSAPVVVQGLRISGIVSGYVSDGADADQFGASPLFFSGGLGH